MLRVIILSLCLGFVVSCAHDHGATQEDSSNTSACSAGDCTKNMNKLGASATEEQHSQPSKEATTKKKLNKGHKSHH